MKFDEMILFGPCSKGNSREDCDVVVAILGNILEEGA